MSQKWVDLFDGEVAETEHGWPPPPELAEPMCLDDSEIVTELIGALQRAAARAGHNRARAEVPAPGWPEEEA